MRVLCVCAYVCGAVPLKGCMCMSVVCMFAS